MKILTSEVAKHYQIDSLQRGHLIFTSFISINGKILFLESHIERLIKGANFLFPEDGWSQNVEKIIKYVEDEFLKSYEQTNNNFYFRLNIFDNYLYLQKRTLENHEASLKITSAQKIKTVGLTPSFLKLSNYIESDLELTRARNNNFNDILYFDINQNLTEASTSNVFIVNTKGEIITPAPSSIVLDGITRKKLLGKLHNLGFNIKEASVSRSDLQSAREIWLTNSVKGIRFVDQFEELLFNKNNSLFLKAKETFGKYGELA